MRGSIWIYMTLLASLVMFEESHADGADYITRHGLVPFEKGFFKDEDNRWKANFIFVTLANTYEVNIHRMNGETGNQVVTDPQGHSEAVYDEDGKLVTDCANMGSYNYHNAQSEALRHFAFDTWPWIEFGNCREDPTTAEQRIEAYLKDLKSSLETVYAHADDMHVPKAMELSIDGQWQTVAFFFLILDSRSGADLSSLLKKDKKERDAGFDKTFSKFSENFKDTLLQS